MRRRIGDVGIPVAVGLLYMMTALGADAGGVNRAIAAVLGVVVIVALAGRRDRPLPAALARITSDAARVLNVDAGHITTGHAADL